MGQRPGVAMEAADLALRFLGVGNSHALELGCSAAVLERAGEPLLLIDCGLDTVHAYIAAYGGRLPAALFITHTHLDHVGGLENLFYRSWFAPDRRGPVKLYVPLKLVEPLHRRLAEHPGVLAEGGVNFWDGFQLIPVSERFWHGELEFNVFPVRHHGFHSAYGLALAGRFLYTGDTRPVPEVLNAFAAHGETIFHDCTGTGPNPSHTGVEELAAEYSPGQCARLVAYHYESELAGQRIEAHGYRVARRGQRFPVGGRLPEPDIHLPTQPGPTRAAG